jgi:hypothetical protein
MPFVQKRQAFACKITMYLANNMLHGKGSSICLQIRMYGSRLALIIGREITAIQSIAAAIRPDPLLRDKSHLIDD